MADEKRDYDHPHFWLRQAAGDMVIARGGLADMLLERV